MSSIIDLILVSNYPALARKNLLFTYEKLNRLTCHSFVFKLVDALTSYIQPWYEYKVCKDNRREVTKVSQRPVANPKEAITSALLSSTHELKRVRNFLSQLSITVGSISIILKDAKITLVFCPG